jgi:adenylate kinase
MVGAPGAGKGTQANVLSGRLGLPHVASGELFREAVQAGTPLGKKVSGYIERGALVPDDLTTVAVMERLAQPDAAKGVILDGFPRTRSQAEALDAALARNGDKVLTALYLHVPPEELLRRLSGRWVCRKEGHVYHETDNPPKRAGVCDIDGSKLYQREDDEPATVQARLDQQLPPMYEVVDHYTDQGVLAAVPGEGDIDEVTAALLHAVDREKARQHHVPTGESTHPSAAPQAVGPGLAGNEPADGGLHEARVGRGRS